jgi:hypothetical protein
VMRRGGKATRARALGTIGHEALSGALVILGLGALGPVRTTDPRAHSTHLLKPAAPNAPTALPPAIDTPETMSR